MSHGSQQVLDRVDGQDRVIGSIVREDVFRKRANFRVAHLFLFNGRSEILLQRLASTRRRHPSRWGSSVAAYVSAGERYEDAVRRRAREELGLSLISLKQLGISRMEEDNGCCKFIGLFSALAEGAMKIDPSHVSEVRFVEVTDVLKGCQADPTRFTPTFIHLAGRFLAEKE